MHRTKSNLPTRHRNAAGGKLLSIIFLLSGFSLIVIATVFPFNFSFPESKLNPKIFVLPRGSDRGWDIWTNVLLYIPWGFGSADYLSQNKTERTARILVLVILTSLIGSYSIEVLQTFLPGRTPSWKDVVSNTFGALLGALCCMYLSQKKVF